MGAKRKRGRPHTGIGKVIAQRWHKPALAKIDAWRMQQPDKPTAPRPSDGWLKLRCRSLRGNFDFRAFLHRSARVGIAALTKSVSFLHY
jgi:hypothetical protein